MARHAVVMLTVAGLALCGCSGQKAKVPMYPEDRLALGERLQAEGKYGRAVTEYETLLSEFPTQEVARRAEFNLATCRMELKDYQLAVQAFEGFIDSHPRSDLVDNAMYMIALSYCRQSPNPQRDQTNTVKALSELTLLLREYPETDIREKVEASLAECRSRLAERDYMSGRLYMTVRYYRAARLYFDSVIDQYGDTRWAGLALLGKGQALAREGKPSEAVEAYRQVLEQYPSSDTAAEATQRLKELGGAIATEPADTPGN